MQVPRRAVCVRVCMCALVCVRASKQAKARVRVVCYFGARLCHARSVVYKCAHHAIAVAADSGEIDPGWHVSEDDAVASLLLIVMDGEEAMLHDGLLLHDVADTCPQLLQW